MGRKNLQTPVVSGFRIHMSRSLLTFVANKINKSHETLRQISFMINIHNYVRFLINKTNDFELHDNLIEDFRPS